MPLNRLLPRNTPSHGTMSACSRAIVLSPVYDLFLERLVEATRSLKTGPAEDPSCTVGPLIDEQAQRRVAKTKRELREEFQTTVLSTQDESRHGDLQRPKIAEGARVRLQGIREPARVRRLTHALLHDRQQLLDPVGKRMSREHDRAPELGTAAALAGVGKQAVDQIVQLLGGAHEVRVYAETDPGSGFSPVDANLEDVYFLNMERHTASQKVN